MILFSLRGVAVNQITMGDGDQFRMEPSTEVCVQPVRDEPRNRTRGVVLLSEETPFFFGGSSLSGPHIAHATSVAWQILEAVEPVEVVDGYRGYPLGMRHEPQVDRQASAAGGVNLQPTPMGYTAAVRAEMERQRAAFSADVGRGIAKNPNVHVLVAIDPENAIAATGRTVARGRSIRFCIEVPADPATETRTLQHRHHPVGGPVKGSLACVYRRCDTG